MTLLVKALLELLRILVLSGLYFSAVGYLISWLERTFNLSFAVWVDTLLYLLFLAIFLYWYRKKGQYSGWYPIKND